MINNFKLLIIRADLIYYSFSSLGLNSSPLFLGNQSSTPSSVQNPSSTMISTVYPFIQPLVQESSDTGMHNAFRLLLMINNFKLLIIRADLIYYSFSSLGLNSSPLFLGNQSSTPSSVQNPSSTMISTVYPFIQPLVQESSDTGMHNAFRLLLMINNFKLLIIRADLIYYSFSSLGLNSSPLFLCNQSSTPSSVQNPSSTMISTVYPFIQPLVQESSDTGMHNAFILLLMINNLKLLVIRADIRS